eukprot:1288252-Amphidinium_carterae.2
MKQSGLDRHSNRPTHYTHKSIWQTTNQNNPQDSTRPTNRQRFELRSPTQPALKQRPGTLQQEWQNKPPNQPSLETPQKVPKFPQWPKAKQVAVQPPPGLQQPELITVPPEPIPPLQQTTEPTIEKTTETTSEVQVQPTQPQPKVRRRITTKTTPAKNDLLATIDTGILHLSTNEDSEEKKLSMDNMVLQDAYELKTAIKEEHNALQKTHVFKRVNANTTTERGHSNKMGNTLKTWRQGQATESTIRSKRLHTTRSTQQLQQPSR